MTNDNIIIYSILTIFSLIILYLLVRDFRMKKKFDLIFKEGKKNLEEVLISQIKNLENQGQNIEKIFKEIEKINRISAICFQKVGVQRYNPFKEVGGDQSFSIALLDAKNNGFVITSLYAREGNRIFAKPIENGQSKYLLSIEEREVIKKALG